MLTERIRINNPSAIFKSVGFLENHKLDFNNKSKVETHDGFLDLILDELS